MTDPDAADHVAELDDILDRLFSLASRMNHKDHRDGAERAMWTVLGVRDSIAGRNGIRVPSPLDGIR